MFLQRWLRLNLCSDGDALARHCQTKSVWNSWGIICSNPNVVQQKLLMGSKKFRILFGLIMTLQIQFWKLNMEDCMYVYNKTGMWLIVMIYYNNQLIKLQWNWDGPVSGHCYPRDLSNSRWLNYIMVHILYIQIDKPIKKRYS